MVPFVWTEAVGCGEILPPMVNSYLAHHNFKLHVFGYLEDLENLPKSELIVPVVVGEDNKFSENEFGKAFAVELQKAYKNGHQGTGLLWSRIILIREEKYLIHLDADSVFLKDVLSPLMIKLQSGFGIVGTRRPYRKKATSGVIKGYRKILFLFHRDAINTHAFGFNREIVKMFNSTQLINMIMGRESSRIKARLFPVHDFFDKVSFFISRKTSIYYLDSPNQNRSGSHSHFGDFESSMISFSAVGSGCNFYKNPSTETSPSYKDFAISSYALYSKYLLGRDLGIETLKSDYLEGLLKNLDTATWTLRGKG